MKEVVKTNREDKFLLDDGLAARREEWLRHVHQIAETKQLLKDNSAVELEQLKVQTFCEAFPEELTVQEYNDGKIGLEKLKIHIAVIESKLPVKVCFAEHGLTSEHLLSKLNRLVDSIDETVSLKAIQTALRYVYPEEKPLRVDVGKVQQQNNYYGSKDELMDNILKKVDGIVSNSK